jgi:sigma-B regulation protein RsbU (phosphoserine phosphatase)
LEFETRLINTLLNAMPDFIFVKDLEGRFLVINEACAKGIGAETPEAAVGKTDFDFLEDHAVAEQYKADEAVVIATGEPLIDREEPFVDHDKSVSWLSTTKVPLRDDDGTIIGIIGIARNITERKEAEQVLAEKSAAMEANLKVAAQFWKTIVPDRCPSFPHGSRYEIKIHQQYLPSEELGGDFFNVRILDDKRVGLFICDVTGHDIRATLVAAMVNGLLEQEGEVAHDPGRVLDDLNNRLLEIMEHSGREIFVTAFYMVIDLEAGTARLSKAGHPGVLHYSRNQQKILTHGKDHPALGIMQKFRYEEMTIDLEDGDLLLLYTDGILEQTNPQGDEYGIDRFKKALADTHGREGDQILERILDDCLRWSHTGKFQDDVCLLMAELTSS